jgi:hypothetical protein
VSRWVSCSAVRSTSRKGSKRINITVLLPLDIPC